MDFSGLATLEETVSERKLQSRGAQARKKPPTAARWLIYGATGLTGRLLAREAAAQGLTPTLAGRDPNRLAQLAGSLRLEYRVARLEDAAALTGLMDGAAIVLNAAGPFIDTAGPLTAACLATGTHYTDVTGEPTVFAALERRDREARRRGVMLLPGAGFVVVATDCLAAHVACRLPSATRLRIGISRPASLGHGTLRTIIRNVQSGFHIREGGRLVLREGRLEHAFDFGRGLRTGLAVDWADLITAWHTTGIPNTQVFLELRPVEREALALSRTFAGSLRSPFGQALLRALLLPYRRVSVREGTAARHTVVAEASDGRGHRTVSRLHTPDSYAFTAKAAVAIVRRMLAGEVDPGFRTPARMYGADFVLSLDGVRREDLPARSDGGRSRYESRSRSSRASSRSAVKNPSL